MELNEKAGLEESAVVEVTREEKEKLEAEPQEKPAAKPQSRAWYSWKLQPKAGGAAAAASSDPEKGGGKKKERKLVLIGPIYAGLGAALSGCALRFLLCALCDLS